MKIQKILAGLLTGIILVVSSLSFADGSITQTNVTSVGSIQRIDLHWSSLTNKSTGSISWLNGELYRVTFVPGASTIANYDVTITDSTGFDILAGLGANLASNTVVTVAPGIALTDGSAATNMNRVVLNDALTVTVDNTGVGSGYLSLFLRK